MPTKSLLIINRSAPYSGNKANEALDVALTFAAFELDVSMVFVDEGVYQLIQQQDGKLLDAKNLANQLAVLPMYEINNIFACIDSMIERNLTIGQLQSNVQAVETDKIKELIRQHDLTLNF